MIVSKFRFKKNEYETYPHLINKINNKQSKFQWVLIGFWCFNFQNQSQYLNAHYFRIIAHLINFWFFYKNMNWDALHPLCIVYYMYWRSIYKGFGTKFCFVPFWLGPCIVHSIYLVKNKIKNESTIERGKIWIPFIKLGIRPTSTLGLRRDQLVFTIISYCFSCYHSLCHSSCVVLHVRTGWI
jgi:hypothetical protein